MVLRILTSVNYGCVLVFGILLSAEISGGCETPRQKRLGAGVVGVRSRVSTDGGAVPSAAGVPAQQKWRAA